MLSWISFNRLPHSLNDLILEILQRKESSRQIFMMSDLHLLDLSELELVRKILKPLEFSRFSRNLGFPRDTGEGSMVESDVGSNA